MSNPAIEKYKQMMKKKIEDKNNEKTDKNTDKKVSSKSNERAKTKKKGRTEANKRSVRPRTSKTTSKTAKRTSKGRTNKGTSMGNRQQSTSSLVDKYRSKLAGVRGGSGEGGKFNYIKFEVGKNFFRFVEPTQGPLVVFFKQHNNGQRGGSFRSAISLSWLVGDEEALEAMMERNLIADRDLELIQQYGDPYDTLWKALDSIGKSNKYKNARIGSKRTMFVVFQEGQFGILQQGIKFGEQFLELWDSNPALTSWDEGMTVSVKATGEGLKRRYGAIIPHMNMVGPLEFPEGEEDQETPNLYDVLAGNVYNYPNKVKFLFDSHGNLADEAGLDYEDFGVTEEEVANQDSTDSSFNYGDNKEEEEKEEYEEDEDDEEDEED